MHVMVLHGHLSFRCRDRSRGRGTKRQVHRWLYFEEGPDPLVSCCFLKQQIIHFLVVFHCWILPFWPLQMAVQSLKLFKRLSNLIIILEALITHLVHIKVLGDNFIASLTLVSGA